MDLSILEQIHDGKTHIGEYLSLIFQGRHITVFWKNKDLLYEGGNQLQGSIAGLSHPKEIIGKGDFDLCWTDAESIAYRKDDQEVINNGKVKLNFIEYQHCGNGKCRVICTTKIPLFNESKQSIGVVGFSSEMLPQSHNVFPGFCSSDFYLSLKVNRNYYITFDQKTIRLTAKQAECLTYLSMGKTVKQIANMVGCTSSTIEGHLDRLKLKLSVYSTSALIDCFWKNPIKWF